LRARRDRAAHVRSELDYLTHLVLRLYESKAVPADHPQRFRLEILFSPGAAYDPTEVRRQQRARPAPQQRVGWQ
jgi:inositol hexakisphosphate/diphosphoinositol-pentakisphosphate kinase